MFLDRQSADECSDLGKRALERRGNKASLVLRNYIQRAMLGLLCFQVIERNADLPIDFASGRPFVGQIFVVRVNRSVKVVSAKGRFQPRSKFRL